MTREQRRATAAVPETGVPENVARTVAARESLAQQLLGRPWSEPVLIRIAYSYEQLVDRIHCQTEELLATVEDPEEAYQLVKVRAGR